MFYITNARYSTFVNSLDLNLPFQNPQDKNNFYHGYKLKSFDLDLRFFTQDEAHALVLSDMLFQDMAGTLNNILIEKIEQDQKKWVFEIGMPCYHTNAHCEYLNSDFTNVRIPASVRETRKDEYRAYFIANHKKYGGRADQIEPSVFARKLIALFNLEESVEDMLQFYIRYERYENSEVAEFNAILDFEKEANTIHSLIDCFTQLINDNEISPENSRRAYFLGQSKSKDPSISEALQKLMKQVFNERKALVARILNYHFRKFARDGFDVNEKLFHLVGFRPCKSCGRHH